MTQCRRDVGDSGEGAEMFEPDRPTLVASV
jgi:hypothetical protein